MILHWLNIQHIHDLERLAVLCEAEKSIFGELKQYVIILTEYGVQPRYPNNMEINEEDMKRALHFATEIKTFFLEKVSELFNEDDAKRKDYKSQE
jgi:hypothetical protein